MIVEARVDMRDDDAARPLASVTSLAGAALDREALRVPTPTLSKRRRALRPAEARRRDAGAHVRPALSHPYA